MVETISPVVYGTRTKWVGAVALHAAGAAATAAAFGAAVAPAGALLGAPWGRAGAVLVVGVSVLYVAREVSGKWVPVPQLRRQVPDWWRTYFGRPVAAFLYGAGLGVGFLTFLGHGTLVAVAAGVAATGRPALGALVMAPFGLARGLAPLTAARAQDPEDGRHLVERLSATSGRVRVSANAVASVAVGAAAAAWAWRAHGGWGEAAAAALAVSFGWAGLSKVAAPRRWRRTLAAHRLPASIERTAGWAVPAVEIAVPTLAILGRERAATALAFASIAAFTVALVRAAVLHGARVPCGCFGRPTVHLRAALSRNAAFAVAAVVSWRAAAPDPVLEFPSGEDVLPALMVAGAVGIAAATAWRAAVWLGRGRP